MPSAPKKQRPVPAPDARSRAGLRRLQQWMAASVMEPLAADGGMRRRRKDGSSMAAHAARVIQPNDRLTAFARLEIYNVQYWLRLLASLREDFPILEAVLGEAAFARLARAYLEQHPSRSFTLRNLGARLEAFVRREPRWLGQGQRARFARDVLRFEWAQVVAFDGEARPTPTPAQLAAAAPARLRLRLQPYLSLLALAYPVDTFVERFQQERDQEERLRSAASQAMEPVAPSRRARRPVPLPKPQATFLAVHRVDHLLYVKRLEPEAFRLLSALERGLPLARACAAAFPALPRAAARREAELARRAVFLQENFRLWAELGWLAAP